MSAFVGSLSSRGEGAGVKVEWLLVDPEHCKTFRFTLVFNEDSKLCWLLGRGYRVKRFHCRSLLPVAIPGVSCFRDHLRRWFRCSLSTRIDHVYCLSVAFVADATRCHVQLIWCQEVVFFSILYQDVNRCCFFQSSWCDVKSLWCYDVFFLLIFHYFVSRPDLMHFWKLAFLF